jgi:hypothetical protein
LFLNNKQNYHRCSCSRTPVCVCVCVLFFLLLNNNSKASSHRSAPNTYTPSLSHTQVQLLTDSGDDMGPATVTIMSSSVNLEACAIRSVGGAVCVWGGGGVCLYAHMLKSSLYCGFV